MNIYKYDHIKNGSIKDTGIYRHYKKPKSKTKLHVSNSWQRKAYKYQQNKQGLQTSTGRTDLQTSTEYTGSLESTGYRNLWISIGQTGY